MIERFAKEVGLKIGPEDRVPMEKVAYVTSDAAPAPAPQADQEKSSREGS